MRKVTVPDWLHVADHTDLSASRGNGPFVTCLGVILHVNAAPMPGTPVAFYGAGTDVNPDSVCPNFQVDGPNRDGAIHQLLPLDWQPWAQVNGNFHYAAIETGGEPDQPLTAAMIRACGHIYAAYHVRFGVPLQVANVPGERGLGWHGMGGDAWGGHPDCPGDLRKRQRKLILNHAKVVLERWRARA